MSLAEPIVICDNLVKIYKVTDLEVVALQGLDLEVMPGEMIAIVGASGSGKSTLLNILSGLDVPSAGGCMVDGNNLARLSAAQRVSYRRYVVGQIWQQSGRNLLPQMSALENVELPLLLSGMRAGQRRRRAQELLESVGVQRMERKKPGELSGGEQQRVALARALVHRPRFIAADEPTGNLDSLTGNAITKLLLEVAHEAAIALLVATHDHVIFSAADRVLHINDGRIVGDTV